MLYTKAEGQTLQDYYSNCYNTYIQIEITFNDIENTGMRFQMYKPSIQEGGITFKHDTNPPPFDFLTQRYTINFQVYEIIRERDIWAPGDETKVLDAVILADSVHETKFYASHLTLLGIVNTSEITYVQKGLMDALTNIGAVLGFEFIFTILILIYNTKKLEREMEAKYDTELQ
jgi:hypothetical protein